MVKEFRNYDIRDKIDCMGAYTPLLGHKRTDLGLCIVPLRPGTHAGKERTNGACGQFPCAPG